MDSKVPRRSHITLLPAEIHHFIWSHTQRVTALSWTQCPLLCQLQMSTQRPWLLWGRREVRCLQSIFNHRSWSPGFMNAFHVNQPAARSLWLSLAWPPWFIHPSPATVNQRLSWGFPVALLFLQCIPVLCATINSFAERSLIPQKHLPYRPTSLPLSSQPRALLHLLMPGVSADFL